MLHQEKSLQHTRHASEPGQTGEFAGQVVISLKKYPYEAYSWKD